MIRLMRMSPLYPCGKPCATGTHSESVKKLALFSAFSIRMMMESRPRISNRGFESRNSSECYQAFNQIESSIIVAVTIVIHRLAI